MPPVTFRFSWRRLATAYVERAQRRPLAFLALWSVLVAAGVFSARRIVIDPSLTALLPADSPSQEAIATLKQRVRSTASMYLVVASSDPALNMRLAERLAEELRAWPETRWAVAKRDPRFFLERRLLFLPPETLDGFATRVQERLTWERCEANPMCVTFDTRPPLPDAAEVREAFRDDANVKAMLGLLGADSTAPSADAAPTGASKPPAGSLCSPDGQVCAVEASLRGDPDNLGFATAMSQRAEALFATLRSPHAPPDLRLEVSGPYRNAPMEKQIVSNDLRRTTLLGAGLIVLLMLVQFRSLRILWLLLVPLVAGIAWTLGLIGLVHPQLNLLSAFGLSLLAGLGIDYGIHLFVHYSQRRAGGEPLASALTETLVHMGNAMVTATATTACGFAALSAARFRGFSQMGLMAGLGVVISMNAFLVVMPPLVFATDRVWSERPLRFRLRGLGVFSWLDACVQGTKRRARIVVAVALVVTIAGGLAATRIGFEYDFRRLRPSRVSHGLPWGKALHGTTRVPVFVLARSRDEMRSVAEQLRARGPEGVANPDEPWLVTAESFIPRDQSARLAALARLRVALEEAVPFMSDEQQRAFTTTWAPLLAVNQPFSVEQAPPWVADWLVERNGQVGSLGIIYTDLSGADARQMQRLASQMARWRQAFPHVVFASPAAQVGEVVPGLAADTPLILGLAFAGLALGTWLMGRSLRRTLLVLTPLAMAMVLTLGIAVAFGVKVNLYNLIVLPLAFGLGVDGAIYLVWLPAEGPRTARHTAAFAIAGSTLTTLAAFGSLIAAENPGIASLGSLALMALGSALVANLVFLPALLRLVPSAQGAHRGPSAPSIPSSQGGA